MVGTHLSKPVRCHDFPSLLSHNNKPTTHPLFQPMKIALSSLTRHELSCILARSCCTWPSNRSLPTFMFRRSLQRNDWETKDGTNFVTNLRSATFAVFPLMEARWTKPGFDSQKNNLIIQISRFPGARLPRKKPSNSVSSKKNVFKPFIPAGFLSSLNWLWISDLIGQPLNPQKAVPEGLMVSATEASGRAGKSRKNTQMVTQSNFGKLCVYIYLYLSVYLCLSICICSKQRERDACMYIQHI